MTPYAVPAKSVAYAWPPRIGRRDRPKWHPLSPCLVRYNIIIIQSLHAKSAAAGNSYSVGPVHRPTSGGRIVVVAVGGGGTCDDTESRAEITFDIGQYRAARARCRPGTPPVLEAAAEAAQSITHARALRRQSSSVHTYIVLLLRLCCT